MFCLEIVVLGTGEKILHLDPEIQSYLKKRNILLEVQDTVSYIIRLSQQLLMFQSFFAANHGLELVSSPLFSSGCMSRVQRSLIFQPALLASCSQDILPGGHF